VGEAIRKDISKQLGREPWELVLRDGLAVVGGRAVDLAELSGENIEAEGAVKPGRSEEHYPGASFGALRRGRGQRGHRRDPRAAQARVRDVMSHSVTHSGARLRAGGQLTASAPHSAT